MPHSYRQPSSHVATLLVAPLMIVSHSSRFSRCFCTAGYAGGGCDQEATDDTPTYGPLLGLLIFVTITTVALIAGIVGLWRYMRNRTLNSEVTLSEAYGQLRNDFNSN